MQFDAVRATLLDKPVFIPFYPTRTEALSEALKRRKITADTDVLVTEAGGSALVLDNAQMSYHHVAQGELNGEPWLVTF